MARTTLRKTLRSRGHKALITILVAARKKAGMTRGIGDANQAAAFFRGRMEAGERRVDVIEFIEIARALEGEPKELFAKLVE